MNKLTDIEIINSVLKGNKADYSLIVDRYKDRAFTLLKNMLNNSMDAEEVLQDCFLKTFYSLGNFRGDSKFSTWFYKIVYNSGLSFLSGKRRKIDLGTDSIDDYFQLSSNEFSSFSISENPVDFINQMLNKMPVKYSLVLIMFYIDGLSVSEISNVLNQSLVNVKVMLHRGRGALRELLLKNNYEEELL